MQISAAGSGTITGNSITSPVMPGLRGEYEICKVRGHVASTAMELTAEYAVMRPPRPVTEYQAETSTRWSTCFYCGTRYRFVTKIEETDSPK